MRLTDQLGRPITDLRIAITNRCNYRCLYCRTSNFASNPPDLSISEYIRIVHIFADLGIKKVRVTGGEPLLRQGVLDFIRGLAQIRNLEDQPLDIAITTNGHLLERMAHPLQEAGLRRVTVSMDAVEPEAFARITRVPRSFTAVLAGVRAAKKAGLEPLKINCVLLRGFNEDQIPAFGQFARDEGVIVRFIEFMPLEEEHIWRPDIVIRLEEILERMSAFRPLIEIPRKGSETARRYRFDDGIGEIGIIAAISHPFCNRCSRIRLTSDGKIRTCLYSVLEHDLAALMRGGASDEEMAAFIHQIAGRKEKRHEIGKPDFIVPDSRIMLQIGG